MPKTRVVLVAMPWNQLVFPSIQIGTLKAALDRYGIEAETRSYYLRFMEHLAGVDGVPFTPADYAEVVFGYPHGLGDWIFTVPPLRAPSKAEDDDYLALLRRRGVAESVIETATRMREHVPEFLEACKDDLTRIGAEIVGFTTSFNQNIPSLALAKLLKEARPDCCVVFGGANCEGPMGVALHENFPFVDVVVRGEGELVFPELCADWIAGYKMRSRRDVVDAPPVRSMADVPLPDYSEYFACLEQSPVRDDLEPLVEVLFESARGCWWGERQHCTFCGLNGETMAFRSKPAEQVHRDIVELARRHRRLAFRAVDNIIDMGYFEKLLPRLRDGGYDVGVFYETKANLRREQVKALRDARIREIQPGIESLSTPILKLMRKGVTALQNMELLKWCAFYDVAVIWNLIYGFPGEDPSEYTKMAELVPSLHHLPPPEAIGALRLDRFSPYFRAPGEHGIVLRGADEHYRFLYPDADSVDALAYQFRFDYADGRDPKRYVKDLRGAVEVWRASAAANQGALRYRRGPGFVRITDRRTSADAADYVLGDAEARLFLECESGTRVERAWRAACRDVMTLSEASAFLDALVAARLAVREGDRYLVLPLPEDRSENDARVRSEAAPRQATARDRVRLELMHR